MSRRSADQIKKDYRTIKHYIRKAQTIKKIASGTGLTVSQVRTSLATYPLHNQRSKKCNRQIQTHDETQERACSKEQFEKQEDMHELASPMYVIDASMLGVQDYEQFLDKMISEGAKIILTNVTISELDTAQKIDSKYGYCARAFLKRAVKNPDIFIPVLISESEYMSNNKVIEYRKTCNWHDNLHDNQIIAYCACSQEKIVLLTADKVMALNARALGVTVMFFENQTQSATTQSPASTLPSAKTETLNIADYDYDNKTLSVTAFITYQQSIVFVLQG